MRPLGCAMLAISYDEELGKPQLYKSDPSGFVAGHRAVAVGDKQTEAMRHLENESPNLSACPILRVFQFRKQENYTLEEAIELAISCLSHTHSMDFKATELEIAVVSKADPIFRFTQQVNLNKKDADRITLQIKLHVWYLSIISL
ncbi:20S proteasome subunit alpha 1 [Schistosoma bovis]|uniref:20S proteasome subunit alpha 1 n=1 Tax=Schistosoma bovis TaxID=6184 RepID=A0A430QP94_SCHBO|nr:20S proteasome subunit alpha 1 [Schistosoma bovis]